MEGSGRLVPSLLAVLLVLAALPAAGVGAPAGSADVQQTTGSNATTTDSPDEEDLEPPRVEAGVDQTVQRNGSVLLDATPSFAESGEIEDYTWSIETPSGELINPTCDVESCRLARFRVPELGRYEVLLRIRDSHGQTVTDTMYVDVVPRGAFGVELEPGPNATAESTGNLTARIAPGDRVVDQLVWYRGERELDRQNVSELGGVYNRSQYVVPGAEYRAVAVPEFGQNASDSWQAASGQGSQYLPDSEGFPYIMGPRLVTGAAGSDGRVDATYKVRTGYPTPMTDIVWLTDGHQAPTSGFLLEESLAIGETHIEAEVVAIEEINTEPHHTDANRSRVPVGWTETTSTTVVYDPAPEIDLESVYVGDRYITARIDAWDRYNQIRQIHISVGGTTYRRSVRFSDTNRFIHFPIPNGEHGSTRLEIAVVDERGQEAHAADSVTLSTDPGSSSPPPYG